jgi:hypothetical protein
MIDSSKIKYNMWVEKYRPNKLDDIVEQNNIINFLKTALETKNIFYPELKEKWYGDIFSFTDWNKVET